MSAGEVGVMFKENPVSIFQLTNESEIALIVQPVL
jgi:hypothetical protein